MYSKGVEYWFGRDVHKTGCWQIVNSKELPQDFFKLIAVELEKLYLANKDIKVTK